MSTALPALPESGAEGTGTGRYLPRFLLWLLERTEGDTGISVPCAEFAAAQSISGGVLDTVLERLRGHAMVRVRDGGPDGPEAAFEPAGLEQARWLRARRASPAERGRYARQALLSWIFARAHGRPVRLAEFFDSRELFFFGEALSAGEVTQAASYLAQQGLITASAGHLGDGFEAPVSLTPLGVDAALSEADVGRYVEQQRELARPTTTTENVFHGTVHNVVGGDQRVSGGIHFPQPSAVPELAAVIRRLVPELGLDEEARAALLEQLDALDGGAGGRPGDATAGGPATPADPDGTPGPDRREGVLERIRTALYASPDTVARQVVLDAVGQAMGRLLG
ncbi:hypothetical protein [Streptomyces sp. JJ36]|uniref:hypothetical protein n=1 Tax=Streptomyces sp. JJ36 TaxID=2736645 RepID=UPI001F3CC38F|nr:hypothetical protein [Streptomyces sp. JJ36]MCF6524711.1 hypothetical protein [Streptomyces sp. JJ36]